MSSMKSAEVEAAGAEFAVGAIVPSDRRDDLRAALRALGMDDAPQALAELSILQLRRSYREQAARLHPDAGGDAWTFVAAQDAYRRLSRFIAARDGAPESAAEEGPLIVAVGGAKGGVGKSMVASSLAILFAASGKRTVAADLDLGAPNLHLLLGNKKPDVTLADFWGSAKKELADCARPTAVDNLSLIAGEGARLGSANPAHQSKLRLIRRLREMPADVVVCDLGAGTALNTLDFWLCAGRRVVVTTTEPTAVLDAYAFVKTALYRQILALTKSRLADRPAAEPIVEFLHGRGPDAEAGRSLRGFVAGLVALDPAAAGLVRTWVRQFRFDIVLNQSAAESDLTLLGRVTELASRNLDLTPPAVRRLPKDNALPGAVARLVPFAVFRPESPWTQAVAEMSAEILGGSEEDVRRMLASVAVGGEAAVARIKTQDFDRG